MESTDEDLKVWLNEIGEEYTLKTLERFHWVFEMSTVGKSAPDGREGELVNKNHWPFNSEGKIFIVESFFFP